VNRAAEEGRRAGVGRKNCTKKPPAKEPEAEEPMWLGVAAPALDELKAALLHQAFSGQL
jgi:hypothetical protein